MEISQVFRHSEKVGKNNFMYKITNDQIQWYEKEKLEDAKEVANSIEGVVIFENRIIYTAPRMFYS